MQKDETNQLEQKKVLLYLSANFSSLLLLEAIEFMEEAVLTELVDDPAVNRQTD